MFGIHIPVVDDIKHGIESLAKGDIGGLLQAASRLVGSDSSDLLTALNPGLGAGVSLLNGLK